MLLHYYTQVVETIPFHVRSSLNEKFGRYFMYFKRIGRISSTYVPLLVFDANEANADMFWIHILF